MTNTAMMGHNNPPSEIEAIKLALDEANAKALKRADALIAAADRVPNEIADQETADKITDLEKQISTCWTAVDNARDKEKRPFLDRCTLIQDHFRPTLDTLAAAKKRVKAIQTKFLLAEEAKEQRRRADLAIAEAAESKRLTDEAAVLEAAGKVSQSNAVMEKAIAKDDDAVFFQEASKATGVTVAASTGELTGSRSSLRYTPTGEIEDLSTLDLEALRPYIKLADAQKFLNAFVKTNGLTKQIKGAKIWNKPDSVNR